MPHVTKADGNCLYNAISIGLFATASYSYKLRVRTCIYMYNNPELLNSDTVSRLMGRVITEDEIEFMLQSSVRDLSKSLADAIINRSHKMCKSSEYGSILEILYISHMLNVQSKLYILAPTICLREESCFLESSHHRQLTVNQSSLHGLIPMVRMLQLANGAPTTLLYAHQRRPHRIQN